MKKILVAVLVLVASTTSVFALDTVKYGVFSKLNNESTFYGLVRYLDVDNSRAEQLQLVFSMTEDKMESALKSNNEVAAEKAMYFNLGNVKSVLSEEQYKKYLVLINVSVYNNNNDTFIAGL
jgi:hypothetical protein